MSRWYAFEVWIDTNEFPIVESYGFTLWLAVYKCACFSTPSPIGCIIDFFSGVVSGRLYVCAVLIWISLILRRDNFRVFNNHLIIFVCLFFDFAKKCFFISEVLLPGIQLILIYLACCSLRYDVPFHYWTRVLEMFLKMLHKYAV